MTTALIVVDMQNDFMPGGALAVTGGDEIVEPINQLMKSGKYALVVASQDWHPTQHVSFASTHGVAPFSQHNGAVVWPDHCIAGTHGASLHADLAEERIDELVQKATDPATDAYSAFDETNLNYFLQQNEISAVEVVGLAFDYCVKATALDAAKNGYTVRVLKEDTRSVSPDNDEMVRRDLEAAGVSVIGFPGQA